MFDRYLDQYSTNKTHQSAVTSIEFEIHPKIKPNIPIKDIPSAAKAKRSPTTMLAIGLLAHLSSNSALKLVVYHTNIICHDFEEDNAHDETDTLILH